MPLNNEGLSWRRDANIEGNEMPHLLFRTYVRDERASLILPCQPPPSSLRILSLPQVSEPAFPYCLCSTIGRPAPEECSRAIKAGRQTRGFEAHTVDSSYLTRMLHSLARQICGVGGDVFRRSVRSTTNLGVGFSGVFWAQLESPRRFHPRRSATGGLAVNFYVLSQSSFLPRFSNVLHLEIVHF